MAAIQNGNHKNPPPLNEKAIKVVVAGEPGCGKTRFIRAYYDRHSSGPMYADEGAKVYPCMFGGNNEMRRALVYEIPGDPNISPARQSYYEKVDVLVFLYAIDDPSSFEMLKVKWIEESMSIIISRNIPIVFIGTKQDLRDDQQVIERLALENQSPVTFAQGSELLQGIRHSSTLMECSANDENRVQIVFYTIFGIFLDNE